MHTRVYVRFYWHQIVTQALPNGPRTLVFGFYPKIVIFQPTYASLKMAQSSLVRPHRRANCGYLEIGPGRSPRPPSQWARAIGCCHHP